jgi:exonuclease III
MAGTKNLTVLAWNCNGIKQKIHKLRAFIEEQKLDLILLQETHLRPSEKLKIRDYNVFRSDYPSPSNRPIRGTAVIIKRKLPQSSN